MFGIDSALKVPVVESRTRPYARVVIPPADGGIQLLGLILPVRSFNCGYSERVERYFGDSTNFFVRRVSGVRMDDAGELELFGCIVAHAFIDSSHIHVPEVKHKKMKATAFAKNVIEVSGKREGQMGAYLIIPETQDEALRILGIQKPQESRLSA